MASMKSLIEELDTINDKLERMRELLRDIKVGFDVVQTRAAELPLEPSAQQNEAFKNDDLIELLYKLAGRVETAGIYGNVRVDDVEFAQYCLHRVEPLIRLRSNR